MKAVDSGLISYSDIKNGAVEWDDILRANSYSLFKHKLEKEFADKNKPKM